jgi:hypothetical protein
MLTARNIRAVLFVLPQQTQTTQSDYRSFCNVPVLIGSDSYCLVLNRPAWYIKLIPTMNADKHR